MYDTFEVRIEQGGEPFSFRVCGRTLSLGVAGPVRYYWMDSRLLRGGRGDLVLRPCIDHWWAVMRSIRFDRHLFTTTNLVMAEIYPLVNTARSLQDVILDAHLGRSESIPTLADGETGRLRRLVGARDPEAIGLELSRLFLDDPGVFRLSNSSPVIRDWLYDGLKVLESEGPTGLRAFVASVVRPEMARLRKRGGQDRARRVLNRFAYEAKLAFYRTYGQAWFAIIPWLIEHRGLDALGERLLRLMHVENPLGDRSSEGLRFFGQMMLNTSSQVEQGWDVFRGHCLALHPLSAILMKGPHYRQALGAWLVHPGHETFQYTTQTGCHPPWYRIWPLMGYPKEGLGFTFGPPSDSREYWDMVAAILMAASEYVAERTRSEEKRGTKIRPLIDGRDLPAPRPD